METPKRQRPNASTRRPNAVQQGLIPPAPHPINNARLEDESYEDYKLRRATTNYILKKRRQGLFWNPNIES